MDRINKLLEERKAIIDQESAKRGVHARLERPISQPTLRPASQLQLIQMSAKSKHERQLKKVDENLRMKIKVMQTVLDKIERNTVQEVLRSAKFKKI